MLHCLLAWFHLGGTLICIFFTNSNANYAMYICPWIGNISKSLCSFATWFNIWAYLDFLNCHVLLGWNETPGTVMLLKPVMFQPYWLYVLWTFLKHVVLCIHNWNLSTTRKQSYSTCLFNYSQPCLMKRLLHIIIQYNKNRHSLVMPLLVQMFLSLLF